MWGRGGDVGAWRRCGGMQGGWWESGRVVVSAEGGLGGGKPLSYDRQSCSESPGLETPRLCCPSSSDLLSVFRLEPLVHREVTERVCSFKGFAKLHQRNGVVLNFFRY